MKTIYNIITYIAGVLLPIPALWNKKLRLFVEGRKEVFAYLKKHITAEGSWVWVHAASLGEFEQGLPVIQALRRQGYKVLVTFFSPSGYEVRKNSPEMDAVCYLPLDTPKNARQLVAIVQPKMAFFVKYEFWTNYLHALKDNGVPTYLISGIFREGQAFFKWYGGLQRACLPCFTHFFVQNTLSKSLLERLGYGNVTVSGDTRFDRVAAIATRDNHLGFMETFKGNSLCVVFGSSWPEDEAVYLSTINESTAGTKFVIAPHNIHPEHIAALQERITKRVGRYSEKDSIDLTAIDVLILDTIGILTKVYAYADVAYVGGGMATGLHNVLEPAVFGVPVVIGKHYEKFAEAVDLVALGGVRSVDSEASCKEVLTALIASPEKCHSVGAINARYIAEKKGATERIMNNL